MDFLKVSDKTTTTTTPCRSDSLFTLNQQQYKDFSFEPHPYLGNRVLGCCYHYHPFTNSQLKELERQALIYKYMISSIPVPFDLLVSSSSPSPSSLSSVSLCNNKNTSGDLEPGRCRRTDGKKWRCSKEVIFNHKYCEKHLHRGRPRSRKLVEPPPYSRTSSNNGGFKKNRDVRNSIQNPSNKPLETRKFSSSENRGSGIFTVFERSEEEDKYLNFIDVWSDRVRSLEKQSTTSSSSNNNLSFHSLDLSMGGIRNNLMGHEEMGLIQMGLGVTGPGREEPNNGYGPYGGLNSLEEMSSWLGPISATPGGPLAEILRPNTNLSVSGDGESYSLTATATPSLSPSRVVKKVIESVANERS
ncbi:unnamed protein product [Cochlearia groenlandica]